MKHSILLAFLLITVGAMAQKPVNSHTDYGYYDLSPSDTTYSLILVASKNVSASIIKMLSNMQQQLDSLKQRVSELERTTIKIGSYNSPIGSDPLWLNPMLLPDVYKPQIIIVDSAINNGKYIKIIK